MVPKRLNNSHKQGSSSRFRNERDLATTDFFTHCYSKDSLSSLIWQTLCNGASLVHAVLERSAVETGFRLFDSQLSFTFTAQPLPFKAALLFALHSWESGTTRELPHTSWKTAFQFSLCSVLWPLLLLSLSFPFTTGFPPFSDYRFSLCTLQNCNSCPLFLKLVGGSFRNELFHIFSCFFTSTSLSPLLLSLTLYSHSLPPSWPILTLSAVSFSRRELILKQLLLCLIPSFPLFLSLSFHFLSILESTQLDNLAPTHCLHRLTHF